MSRSSVRSEWVRHSRGNLFPHRRTMGLHIQLQFETPEGLPVTSVYCRIGRVIFDRVTSHRYSVTLQPEAYVSRDHRLQQKRPLQPPGLPAVLTFLGTFGDMAYVYSLLKTHLESQGLTVEDVIEPPTPEPEPEPTPEASPQSSESTPSTLPTPPPPSESPESSPEPQQPPSSEYAPAPATTEA